jgi:hypothetical protein
MVTDWYHLLERIIFALHYFAKLWSTLPNRSIPIVFQLRGTGRRTSERPVFFLVLFLTCLLAAALASQRFFYSLSLAGLQVKRVTFYFLNNVLGLYLSLKPPKCVFEGFTLLKSNFRQRTTPPHPSKLDSLVMASIPC